MSTKTLLTLDEFLSLPDLPGKQELLNGELISLPPAKLTHMGISKRLYELLRTVLESPRVWIETGYQLHGRMLQPDVSVIWPDQRVENDWLQGSPMLAIEVASRGNSAEEIEAKVTAYLEEGAAEVWIIYPKTCSMTVFRSDHGARRTGRYECELIGCVIDVSELIASEK